VKVVVVGAGLGGLAVSRGLRQAGVEAVVYERDAAAASRFQGWRIGLTTESLDTLRWCLPSRLHPLLAAVEGEEKGEGRAVDPQLNVLGTSPADHEGRLHDRDVLRHLLLDGVPVRFGAKLDRYEELPCGGVRVHFADGRTDTADVLVAADGMGSTVRRQLLPDVHEVDLGIRGVIGRTAAGPVVLLGDAVHPMPPGGLGANLAFRDARLLCALLTGGAPVPAALVEYQCEVLAYGSEARDQALAHLSTFV
jgi:2-polyprenyl-6-methoxyphenol hydroxylase-like FAD-dependent oxidoreductase